MEFKMGHQVLAWNNNSVDKPVRGTYLYSNDRLHAICVYNGPLGKMTLLFANVKLDPDATEFVTGDKVEFRDHLGDYWYKALYGHYANNRHMSTHGVPWRYCKYPKPQLTKKERAIKIIDNFVSEAVECMEIPDKEDIEDVYKRLEEIYNE